MAVKMYCERCGRVHNTEWQRAICMTNRQIRAMRKIPHRPEGTKDVWWPSLEAYHNYNWKDVQKVIMARDGYTCQDCGLQHRVTRDYDKKRTFLKSGLEVHHIIPRGMGGTNHPANLKVVCQNCHKKYNERFNGRIIRQKAKLRRAEQLGREQRKLAEIEGR